MRILTLSEQQRLEISLLAILAARLSTALALAAGKGGTDCLKSDDILNI